MAVKKSIAIIGEGETEWWYFETLRVACRYKFKVAPDFPQHSDIPHMAKLAEDYVKRETDHVVCLVDMDRLLKLPAEMATYQQLRKSSSPNVIWIETNPCTEFWFLLHFAYYTSNNHRSEYIEFLRKKFKGLGLGAYEKNRKDTFAILQEYGNEDLAIRYAKRIIADNEGKTPTEIAPGTKVYELVEELRKYCGDTGTLI